MIWSDHKRYHQTSLAEPTIFPNPDNYNNLDKFLHDIRLAVLQEKKYRRHHQLGTYQARLDHHLDIISRQYSDMLNTIEFDVI